MTFRRWPLAVALLVTLTASPAFGGGALPPVIPGDRGVGSADLAAGGPGNGASGAAATPSSAPLSGILTYAPTAAGSVPTTRSGST